MPAAHPMLDPLQSLARIDALADEPARFADALAAEHALAEPIALDALLAHDAGWRDALAAIDALAERRVRLALEHPPAAVLAAATRKVFAATCLTYADRTDLLAARAADAAARERAPDPRAVGDHVVDAVARAIALRDALRAPALAALAAYATHAATLADRAARDRALADATRTRWSAARRDLETLASQPAAIAAAPMAERMAAWPAQLDEPAALPEPTLAELIELD